MHKDYQLYRVFEVISAVAVILFGIRTALPLGHSTVYVSLPVKITFGLIGLTPGIIVLAARSARGRVKALLWITITDVYLAVLAIWDDWTRFGSAGASLALAAVSLTLYARARAEVHRP